MSAVRNVADFGQPTAGPVHASTSSTVISSSVISRSTLSIEKRPNAVGDEVGPVLGDHNSFTQPAVAKISQGLNHVRPCFWAGDQLDQLM